MSWTDEEIDQLFRERANDLSFEYKPEFWEAFSSSLSSVDLGGMSGEYHEVDQLYQLSANEMTFEYKDAYWKEIEGMLPRRRRPDFLWFGTALFFLGALTVGRLTVEIPVSETPLQANAPVLSAAGAQNEASVPVSENHGPVLVNEPGNLDEANSANDLTENPDRMWIEEHGTEFNQLAPGQEGNLSESFNPLMPTETPGNNELADGVNPSENLSNPGDQHETNVERLENEVHPVYVGGNMEQDALVQENTQTGIEQGEIDRLPTRDLPGIEEQMMAASDLPAAYDFKLPVISSMYIELNGGLSQSLITPSSSLSYSGGLGIGARFIKGRFTFNAGLNGQISFHDDIVLNREAKVYGFGSEVYRYTLKYDQMYTAEAVFGVGYRFGSHQINLGVRPSYLVGTKVGVTMLEQEMESDRQTIYGHTEGLKRFGLKPTLGYSFDLRGNITLGLNLGVQTMKLVEEDFIDGKNNTLPMDLQFYLRKGIRFRK